MYVLIMEVQIRSVSVQSVLNNDMVLRLTCAAWL
jgi:hypothetical protein